MNTTLNLVPQCENCGAVLDNLTMTYRINEDGMQTVFSPNECPKCGDKIAMLTWPNIPLYADSKDGDVVTVR